MKTLKTFIFLLAATLGFASCEKDGDKIYLSSIEASELMATESAVVLSQENSKDIVLSLAWTKDALQISDPALKPIDVTIQTLQVSTTPDFTGVVTENVETSLSKAYTGSALNTLAKNVGATPDVANSLYFRLAAQAGKNMTPAYSNVVSVSVTPYIIDMSLGYVLNSKKAETGVMLYSAASDGEYLGFMGATSWYNYYLREGDGTVWGNDGVTGTPFLMSSADDDEIRWNFWFPGLGGCYYVDVNTGTKLWSALYIPSLTLSGDVTGEMTFDRPNVKWTYQFEAAQAGTLTFKAAGTGRLYNSSTGTDGSDGEGNPGIETPVAFAQNGESLIFGASAGDITVNVPAAGTCTLVIDLSNPTQWTAQVVSGSEEPAQVNEYVYLPGIDDAINADKKWTFDNYLRLYDEDNLGYAGVANIGSQWGYQVAIEKDNWADYYALGEGDAYSGTLVFKSSSNIPAPEAGLYFMNVSLQNLTYALTAVGDVIYYSGISNDWALHPMAATETPGVFSAEVEVTGESSYGFQIVLDQNWTTKLGGRDGILLYQGNSSIPNIAFDKTSGTYNLTVDLIKGTYTIE